LEAVEPTEAITESSALRNGKKSVKPESSEAVTEDRVLRKGKDSVKTASPEIKDEFDDRDWEIMDSLRNDPDYDD